VSQDRSDGFTERNPHFMSVPINRIARWFALVWAIAVYAVLQFLPVYSRATSSTSGTRREGHATLLSVNGMAVLLLLGVPVLAAALTFLPVRPTLRRPAVGIASAMAAAFVLVGAMSVGLFFLPTAVALLIAAAVPDKRIPRAT
jgi:glucan phosphoethanolaminetransferase (alkaline phosphatase superfamily)